MGASPAVQVFIELLSQNFPDLGGTCDDPEEARRMLREQPEIPLAPVELASVEDRAVPGPGGDVRVRVYTPVAANRNVVVYYHGGGWVIGDVDTHDRTTRRLARDTGATVVSVDYRCAPEHRFPAAADDAYAALVWAAEEYDPPKLAVAGDSAGGNLSAVVALMARDRGSPRIDHQLLVYPVTDCTFDTDSYRENGTGEFFLSETHMRWFWDQYLGPDGDGGDPYASPLRAEDLSGLPPATVVTAELDPLRDEGEAYAAALAAAGVPVEHHRADGMFHGFFGVDELLPEAAPSVAWTVERLRGALA
jgi:acetyl esterase/lipase